MKFLENNKLTIREGGPTGLVTFVEQIVEASKEGWVLDSSKGVHNMPRCIAPGYYSVVMVKSDAKFEAEVLNATPEELLEIINSDGKKERYLQIAEILGLTVPADLKLPTQIGKFLRDSVAPQLEAPVEEEVDEG